MAMALAIALVVCVVYGVWYTIHCIAISSQPFKTYKINIFSNVCVSLSLSFCFVGVGNVDVFVVVCCVLFL